MPFIDPDMESRGRLDEDGPEPIAIVGMGKYSGNESDSVLNGEIRIHVRTN